MTPLPTAQYVRPVERPKGVPRVRLSKKPVIASQSADWRGNLFPNRTIFTLFCEFATKRLRIPTSLRSSE